MAPDSGQEGASLGRRQRSDLVPAHSRRVDKSRNISAHQVPALCLPKSTSKDGVNVLNGPWRQPVAKSGRENAMTPLLDILFPSKTWACVFWDDTALLFLKRTPMRRTFVAAHEYAVFLPHLFPPALRHAVSPKQEASYAREVERHRQEVAESRVRQRLLAPVTPPAPETL